MKKVILLIFLFVGVLSYSQVDPVLRSFSFVTANATEMNAIPSTKITNGQWTYRLDTETVWIYDGFSWVNTGLGINGSADSFDKEWTSLLNRPTGLDDGDDDTQLSDAQVETAYNNRVVVVPPEVAEIGTSIDVYRWTPQRINQAIQALAVPDGSITELKLNTTVNASLDLADSSIQPADNISTLTNDAGYITEGGNGLTGSQIIDSINTELGSTAWQGGGSSDLSLSTNTLSLSNPLTPGNSIDLSTLPILSDYLPLAGGTMTGNITLSVGNIIQGNNSNTGIIDMTTIEGALYEFNSTIGIPSDKDNYAWSLSHDAGVSGAPLEFKNSGGVSDGAKSTVYTINYSGTPSASTDLIPKGYADANYGGGGSSLPVDDTTSLVQDPVDNTKQVRIDAGAITTGTTRTITMPDADVDLGNLPTLENANQSITEDRTITVSGTGTDFTIGGGAFRYSVSADPNDNTTYLGNFSQGLRHSINGGWIFDTPFTLFSNVSAPTSVEGRMYYNTTDNAPYYNNGTTWVEIGGGSTQNATEVPMTGYVEGTDATAPADTDNVAEAIAKLKNITDGLVSSTYPSTAQQYYVIGASAKDTITDVDMAAAANYKSAFYRNIDTLIVGDGLTFATHGNKPIMVQPTSKDSTYIKKADAVNFYVSGQKAAITGDGLVVKNRNTAVGYKEGADDWYWSGDLTVHTEVTDAILSLNPDLYVNNTSIVATGTTDGDNLTEWTDLSGNGNDAVPGTAPDYFNGTTGPQVNFDGSTEWLDVSDASVGDYTLGVDEFTIVVREGDTNATTGYLVSKAVSTSTDRLWGIFKTLASNYRIMHGGSELAANSIATTGNKLLIVVYTTTTVTFYVDGTQVATDTLDTTYASNSAQSINIGARTGGGYLYNGDIDLVAVIPIAVDGTQRAAIETEFQVN